MSQYTKLLAEQAEALLPEDDRFKEKLLEIAGQFRGFGEALTSFMQEHGYAGDVNDTEAKAGFLRERFKAAGVKQPRNFKKWFLPNAGIERSTAYQICFAFGLDVSQTNDFFRCVLLERGFDCHTINEAVYFFCMQKGLSYTEAGSIIGRIPDLKKIKALPDGDVHYTGTIIEDLKGIEDSAGLIEYITDNISDFRYNNATAIRYLQELWAEISKPHGLAVSEGKIIDGYNRVTDKKNDEDQEKGYNKSKVADKSKDAEEDKLFLAEDFVVAKDAASTWTVLTQILGMSNYMEKKYARTRSLKDVLSQNALVPLKTGYCFPSQQGIDRIIRGELCENEVIRKLLILFVFYTYWAKIIIKNKDAYYTANSSDVARCLETINNYLLNAGYPELYAGNPYDWIFMWSLGDDYPLAAFRYYMGEVFATSEE